MLSTASDVVKPSMVGESNWNTFIGSSKIAIAKGFGGINLKATPSNTKQTNKVNPFAKS